MRSIGKVNIRKLSKIVQEEMDKRYIKGALAYFHPWNAKSKEAIIARIPSEWYDIWESAYTEIHRLVDDMMFNYKEVTK